MNELLDHLQHVPDLRDYTQATLRLSASQEEKNALERQRLAQEQERLAQERQRLDMEQKRNETIMQLEIEMRELVGVLMDFPQEQEELHHQPIMETLGALRHDIVLILNTLNMLMPFLIEAKVGGEKAVEYKQLIQRSLESRGIQMQVSGNSEHTEIGDVGGDLSGTIAGRDVKRK